MIVYDWVTQYLALTGSGRIANSWQCPAHDDASPSLSVNEARDGKVLMHCHAGCSYADVVEALSLPRWIYRMAPARTPADWLAGVDVRPAYPPVITSGGSGSWNASPEVSVQHHEYVRDQIRLERVRHADGRKRIRWERRVGKHWEYLNGDVRLTDLPLYRLDYLKQARALGEPVVLCESESSVDALIDAGIYATTWAGGATAPNITRLRQTLGGLTVVWIPDNDPAGRKCSDLIHDGLADVATVHTLWPEPGQDARDLLAQLGADRLRRQIDEAISHSAPAPRPATPLATEAVTPSLTDSDWAAINTLRRSLMQGEIPEERRVHRHPRRAQHTVDPDQIERLVEVIRQTRSDDPDLTDDLLLDWLSSQDVAALADYPLTAIRSLARHLTAVPAPRLPRAMAVFLADIPPGRVA
jgi:DNA primase